MEYHIFTNATTQKNDMTTTNIAGKRTKLIKKIFQLFFVS